MKRNIWFWLYFIIAIILAIYFATRITMVAMGYGELARVRRVSISADKSDSDLSAIAAAAAVAPNTRAYRVRLDDINARINAIPMVKNSAVRRRPNGNLSVRVELYRPVAQWTDGAHFYPLSADGTILQEPFDAPTAGTVIFRGDVPHDISEITNAAHNLIGDLAYLEWVENRRWNIITTGGILVMLPENNPSDAIGALIVLNKNNQILSRDIRVIDMRDNARVLVK